MEINLPSTSSAQATKSSSGDVTTSEFVATPSELGEKVPHLITQADFNDLKRDSKISSRSAEVIGSRLQQWNLVAQDFRVTSARKRKVAADFDNCFSLNEENNIAYCHDVDELFSTIGHPHIPNDWRLFIDSSTESLKGVLLHNGNLYPSVPIVYGKSAKEDYNTIKLILALIRYEAYDWQICCDLKMVGILFGMKKGFPTYQCFLCLWEGRKTEKHYTDHAWPPRLLYDPAAKQSIDFMPLVPASKIILPPLHIKLGLIRSFIIALNRDGGAFDVLKEIFPGLSQGKIAAGKILLIV